MKNRVSKPGHLTKINLKADLEIFLRGRNVLSYLVFEEIFHNVLLTHAPIKQKVARANHAPYVTKEKSSNESNSTAA